MNVFEFLLMIFHSCKSILWFTKYEIYKFYLFSYTEINTFFKCR